MLRKTDVILIAEDDENDIVLLRRAFAKNGYDGRFEMVSNGDEAVHYLQASGRFSDRVTYPFPSVIITDLKMPNRDSFYILSWLHSHLECSVISVIVLSSSNQEQDIKRAYQLGANSYFVKPAEFSELQKLIGDLCHYWSVCARPMGVEEKGNPRAEGQETCAMA